MGDEVTIELAWREVDADAVRRGEGALSTADRNRRDRFTHIDARDHLVASRGLFADRLDARGIVERDVVVGEHGKPYLPGGPAFNLSHSNGAVALALCTDEVELGVDIEAPWRSTDFDAVAKRFFASAERLALQQYPEEARRVRFFELWTLKEAVLKSTGKGLHTPLSSVVFRDDGARWHLDHGLDGAWSLRTWTLKTGHLLSAAVPVGQVVWDGPTEWPASPPQIAG